MQGPHAAVMIVGSRGNSCTGIAVARDLVLTAAHCVPPGADYKLVAFDAQRQPTLRDTQSIARHPQFSQKTFDAHRATADVALIKVANATSAAPAVDPWRATEDRAWRPPHGAGLWPDPRWRWQERRHIAQRYTHRHRPARQSADPPHGCIHPQRAAGTWRLHRRFRRAGVSRHRRPHDGRRRRELVDRRRQRSRMRRAHRRHAAVIILSLDRRNRAQARQRR